MESRVSRAVATFEEGYNCCQSVFSTYADLFGMDRETALKLSCSMGAGVGRMREVCGTVSAMALLAGLKTGNTDPQNQAAKTANYELVRLLADTFREEQGAIVCREILGIRGREKSAAPTIRTKEYYRTRPCSRTVACASRIIETVLLPELFGEETEADDLTAVKAEKVGSEKKED
ncbi:MAG: C_GCAxxG_C_C family protein [Lachnospiraceae bacterium]|nr:C_GCAxxG_C_C family protein [Lachnospiraceae bacterium]